MLAFLTAYQKVWGDENLSDEVIHSAAIVVCGLRWGRWYDAVDQREKECSGGGQAAQAR